MAKLKKAGLVLLAVLLCICAAVCFSGMTESRRVAAQDAQYTSISVALADEGDTLYTSLTADGLKAKLIVTGYTAENPEGAKLLPDQYTLTVNGAGVSGTQLAGLVSGSNNIRVEAGGASAALTVSAVANSVSEITVTVSEDLEEGTGEYAGLWVNAEGFPVFFTDMSASDIAQYLVVDVTYADGSTAEDIEDYSVTGRWNTAEEQTLTIEYTYSGTRYTGFVSIAFTERSVVEIQVSWGGELNDTVWSGLSLGNVRTFTEKLKDFSVQGKYNDGRDWTALPYTEYELSGDLYIAGTEPQKKTITVIYNKGETDIKTTFEVVVTPETPSSVMFMGELGHSQYTYTPLDPSGLIMNVLYPSGGYKYAELTSEEKDHYTVKYYNESEELLDIDYITLDVASVILTYTENGVSKDSPRFLIPKETILLSTKGRPVLDTTSKKYDPNVDAVTTTMTGFDEESMKITFTVTDTQTGEEYVDDKNLTWKVEGDTVTFSATAAGVYKIAVELTDQNYIWAGSGDVGRTLTYEWTVDKASATPTVTIDGWTYNTEGKHNEPKATLAGDSNASFIFTYTGTPNGGGWQDFGTAVPVDAGEYIVQATTEQSRNYFGGSSATCSFIIERADAPVPTLNPKTYTGTTLTATVPESPQYYTTYENKGGIDVGTYYVLLELADANNYKWPEGTVLSGKYAKLEWQIVKAQVTVPSLASGSTVFQDDESGKAVEQSNAINDFIDGRFEFTVSSGSGARVENELVYATNAGTYTITVKIADEHERNYEWIGGGTQTAAKTESRHRERLYIHGQPAHLYGEQVRRLADGQHSFGFSAIRRRKNDRHERGNLHAHDLFEQ